MTQHHEIVFLFDVDSTLLDNDRLIVDLRRYLEQMFGPDVRDRYLTIFEEFRAELGYTDSLGTLQRYWLEAMCDPNLLMMSEYLVDYSSPTAYTPACSTRWSMCGSGGRL